MKINGLRVTPPSSPKSAIIQRVLVTSKVKDYNSQVRGAGIQTHDFVANLCT